MEKQGIIGPIDIIAGTLLIVSGIIVAFGRVNLGSLIASLGLLIELMKIVINEGG